MSPPVLTSHRASNKAKAAVYLLGLDSDRTIPGKCEVASYTYGEFLLSSFSAVLEDMLPTPCLNSGASVVKSRRCLSWKVTNRAVPGVRGIVRVHENIHLHLFPPFARRPKCKAREAAMAIDIVWV